MSGLWSFSPALDDAPPTGRRFAPDELMVRKMQAAVHGEPSGYCDVCGQMVRLNTLRFNEQRWNTDQSASCSACRKYGDPHGREPANLRHKYTCDYCESHTDRFYRVASLNMLLCWQCIKREKLQDSCEYVGTTPNGEGMINIDTKWYESRRRLGTCQVCGDDHIQLAETFNLPGWLLKKQKYHVCLECAELAREMT